MPVIVLSAQQRAEKLVRATLTGAQLRDQVHSRIGGIAVVVAVEVDPALAVGDENVGARAHGGPSMLTTCQPKEFQRPAVRSRRARTMTSVGPWVSWRMLASIRWLSSSLSG